METLVERVRIGTRASALARWQTDEVVRQWHAAHPGLVVEVLDVGSAGDDNPDAPLERMEGIGFFTSTLERALLESRIDVAVHSYKDLPVQETAGLAIAAVPPRGPIEDALCARGARLEGLRAGARVGTSSLRRIAQLRALRPDLECVALRGNVPTRIERVQRGELDAVVLARAGLERLGLAAHISEVFPVERFLTAPAQGALAIQVRRDDLARLASLARIDHAPTRRAVDAERAVLHALRGGCSVPVGAAAEAADSRIALDAGVFAPDGRRAVRVRIESEEPVATGAEAARRLLAQGAGEILVALERAPRVGWEART